MSSRLRAALACVLLAPAARPASAADALLERVERALASARGDTRKAPADLVPLLESLEQRGRAQQAEFDAAAARPLPPKARQRLEETRKAWAAGQGRLPQRLRALRAPVSPSDPELRRGVPAAPDRVDEVLALLRRLRAASRTEPLSEGELKTRVPELRAPALALGPTTLVVPGDEPAIGTIAPEIRRQAEAFSGPIETYEWVRNTVRPELYHGFMKGPLQTLTEASGNDADTAGLLIALLRAKGIPARYVRGTVELSAVVSKALTGTASPERALRAFERAGVPAMPVSAAGGIAAIKVERIWAEAYLPYANYRGALLDSREKAWVPLDAGFKRLGPPGDLDLRPFGLEAEEVFEDYLEAPPGATPLEAYRTRARAILAERRPDLAYEEALARRDVVAQSLGLLPSTLPYTLVARAEVSYSPPELLVHTARFVLESEGTALLDATVPTTSLLGQRLTLSYVPFDEGDEDVVGQYGGLFLTPPYLVDVRPVLKLAGVVFASGTGGAGLGVTLDFRIELRTPGGSDTVENRVLAGNLTAIGLAAGEVTAEETGQDEAARVLARLAFHYLDRWNRSDEELAALFRVIPIRPSVSTCLVQSAVQVEYAGGDPLYPVRYEWKGLAIDADRRPSAPVGIESDAAERDFLLASGVEGSVLEHRLFEDDLGIASVSTAKALQLAAAQGIEVLDLGPEDAESLLPGLLLDERVKDEILEAAAKGYRIRVPAASLALQAWTGTGYLIQDPGTGESAWQLQGGHSGGVTAPAVVDLPSQIVDVVWRQSESPAPRPGAVAFLQKFDTTDLQMGTVDEPLPKPFKVLVTDEAGFPVPGAPVTFGVIGGGGLLVDPATGRASASEITVLSCVGGETSGPCASLEAGAAIASLRLGRKTGEIPRYTCEEPYTCTCPEVGECDRETVGYMTQVGMNLVTAWSGDVSLAEPFTTFAFPERRPAEGVPGAIQVVVGLAAPPVYNPVNLTVADRMALLATDRHGNPISNVLLSVAFEGPPELGPPPEGGSLFRPATTTPGHVLRESDYARCLEDALSVVWGQCPGEAESVKVTSSSRGASVFPVLGDSPWSYYKFNFGTTLNPALSWVKYHTNGMTCPRPDPSACAAWDSPQTLVWQGTRPAIANLQGNVVEAYQPRSAAEVGLWADVVYEEAKVTRSIDDQGREHYRAAGTNVWRRERLADSEFSLRPLSPGTTVDATAVHVGEGRYKSPMILAPDPRQNTVEVVGRHYAPLVKYVGAAGGDVDPATIDPGTLTLTRVKDPARPIQIVDDFSVWGVEPRITKLDPSPVFLSAGGLVTRESTVSHDIEPPEYGSLLAPNDVRFAVYAAADDAVALVANGAEAPQFRIPAGLSLASGEYYARLSLLGVSGDGTDLSSASFPVPICSLVDLLTPVVEVDVIRDPLNGQLCGQGDRIRFRLCRSARVTLMVAGAPFTASLDGGAPQPLADLSLAPGLHEVLVPAGLPELESDQMEPFTLEARDAEDPLQTAVADGVIRLRVVNRSVLPVGHTFVKGVDLLDGHLVQQSTDFKVPGRHLGLEVTRTYSSAGSSSQGPLGGGWSLGYAAGLFIDGGCGLASVVTPDGSSQVFRSHDGLLSFTPQKGYHTRLDREGSAYRFTDKAGNVHLFESPDADGRPRLDSIREPHGDRLVLTYDGSDRLAKVAEVQEEAGEGRAVTFTYRPVHGEDRIVRAEIAALGLVVDYEYDARGNLTRATRNGQNLAGAEVTATAERVEAYRYLTLPAAGGGPSADDHRKEHQLVEVTDPNGHRREYVYYAEGDSLPGEAGARGQGILFEGRWELVKHVLEHPDPGLTVRTEFLYDLTHWPAGERWTTVRDGRGKDTLYVLNGNGSPVRIEEPIGKTTRQTWMPDDILKTREQDANGRVTEFEYDTRGNLTLERVVTADLGPVVTQYRYDDGFNKLTYKKDAEGRETNCTIHPGSGDLLAVVDAVQNRTTYEYDDHGRLLSVTDPRRHVTIFRNHDSFGSATEIEDPLGNVTTRAFDERGRLVQQSDTTGRETRHAWDGLDRLARATRVAGGDSEAEVTETAYHPGGEVRLVRNANGAETSFTIDGLGRVVGTEARFDGQVLTTATTWDPNGNKETETDRRGVKRRLVHDDLNRLTSVEITSGLPGEGPTGTIAGYGYDLVGNKTSETDLAGLVTRFEHDGLYRTKAKVLPEANPDTGQPYREEYVHDLVGNLQSQKDANGRVTAWAYDGLNRRVQTTNALGQVTTETYLDPDEPPSRVNKSEEHDQVRGLRTTYRYDALNRETERRVSLEGEGGGGVTYTTATAYDDRNHSVSVTDARGQVTMSRLDGLDRVVEQTVDPGGLGLVTLSAYDGLGNRKSATDANGYTTRYRHDGLGRLVEVVDALQQRTVAIYDGEGLKTSETDRRGVTTLHTYDNLGRPRRSELAAAPFSNVGWSREIQYVDAIPALRRETDANGRTTVFELDGLDRVVKETDALTHTVQTTWDGVNRRVVRDKRGNETRFEYDAVNRVTKVTDPAPFQAQTVETTYQDSLNRITEKDRRGTLKVTQTDPLGRVVKVTAASGTPEEATLERNTYDPLGNKVLALDGEGKKTQFVYDNANRLASRTDGFETTDAATTQYRYDPNGNQTKVIDPRSSEAEPSAESQYDELNRVQDAWDGERSHTEYGYDSNGNRTSVKTPKGLVTTYQYDELNKLTSVTQPPPSTGQANPVTQYAYDPNRNHVRQEDANGHVVAMEYDELNRLKKTTQDPGGLGLVTETTRLDANGNPEERVDAKGQKVTNIYDELNRVTSKTYAFAPNDPLDPPWRHTTSTDYAYDANGNLLHTDEHVASGSDPPSVTLVTGRTYDLLDRLSSETEPLPDGGTRTVGYAYYANGTRKTVTDPAGAVTQYTYDGQNRLQGTTTDFGTAEAKATSHGYWPDGLLRTVTYPNGVVATHTYDKADRLLTLASTQDATTVTSYAYTYDPNGNRLTQAETNGGPAETTAYTYDDLDRLATITYPVDATYPNGRVVSYGYDGVGNRVRETEKDSADTVLADKQGIFDNLNRLTTLNDLVTPANSTTFAWDPNGNQTSKTTNGVTTVNIYDTRDKLAEVTQGPSTPARFQYDAEGRLLKKIGEEGIRQYVYDQTSRLAEYDAAGAAVARFSYGSDRLISMWHLGEGTRFYHLDGLRSVTALTDTAGAVTANLRLDAWGNFRFPADLTATANRFAFTGHIFDTETQLYFAKARFYDPKLGRFISQDSFLGQIDEPPSLHRYLYANDNPTTYWDPTGHASAKIGYVYVVRGVDPTTSEPVSYTGSTIQELKARFGTHKWRQLIKAETTTIDVQEVSADVDVAASGRRTMRSAKLEAVRAPEEGTRQRVAKEPARPLNEVAAATEENTQAWTQRHKVQLGKSFVYKSPSAGGSAGTGATPSVVTETGVETAVADAPARSAAAEAGAASDAAAVSGSGARTGMRPKIGGTGTAGAFAGLAVYDAIKMSRERSMSKYVIAPYVLEDEGGAFTVSSAEGLFSGTYEKRYIEGDAAGTVVPIKKKEFYELKGEAEALWGRVDWKGDWVPGKLRKELPVIEPDGGT